MKEWLFIILFSVVYALGANLESRIGPPIPGSLATKQRAWVVNELSRIDRKHSLEHCQSLASNINTDNVAIIWYHKKAEYWCGYLDLEKVSQARILELKPYTKVLNTR